MTRWIVVVQGYDEAVTVVVDAEDGQSATDKAEKLAKETYEVFDAAASKAWRVSELEPGILDPEE